MQIFTVLRSHFEQASPHFCDELWRWLGRDQSTCIPRIPDIEFRAVKAATWLAAQHFLTEGIIYSVTEG
ncbi:hypothetical protein HBA54_17275 [Pelagibius litoralis]|uniref:Uncharacterized protein n=1 Tax=Pelagibius litoralis TaxID=374515 RepID=A0A967EZP1_9PROT|nr:hypothetical protein [Pelagibius litoralis]NIA70360.1 hypothetical protein [Pelagibius litoralis]